MGIAAFGRRPVRTNCYLPDVAVQIQRDYSRYNITWEWAMPAKAMSARFECLCKTLAKTVTLLSPFKF